MSRLGRSRPPKSYVIINEVNPLDFVITANVAMAFNPAMSTSVTVANPITTTVTETFNAGISTTITETESSTVTETFNAVMTANVIVGNPITSTVAMTLNPSVSASVIVPYIATTAMTFNPSMTANASFPTPITSTVAMGFNAAMAAVDIDSGPFTSTVAMILNPTLAVSATWPQAITATGSLNLNQSVSAAGDNLSAFTTNYHPNPAFQNGIAGFAAATAESIVNLDTSNMLYGTSSLLVTCPGVNPGEGVITPSATIPLDCTGSVSCHVNGTGSITAYVYADGNIVGVQHITLTQQWNRVIIQDIAMVSGNEITLHLTATKQEASQFWCAGFQVEPTSPCHPYVDGDLDGCNWRTGFFGISYCLYENPIKATSIQHGTTAKVNILDVGEAFSATVLASGKHTYNPVVFLGAAGPVSAIKDFSVSSLTDPDPAQTYVSWNNAGILMGSPWQQSWATFVPPNDYVVSNGDILYKRAAFAAIGWDFQSAVTNNYAQLTRAYTGIAPLVGGSSPPAFDNPRTIHSIIIADRINFVNNPSFEVSTFYWSPVGSSTLAQDSSVTLGEIGVYDEDILTGGAHSCNVTLNANFDGASIVIPDLLPGFNYTASVYVKAGLGLSDIVMDIGGVSASIQSSGGTGYDFDGYGNGPYGGFDPITDVSTATWYRIWCTFTASGDSETLQITSSPAVDISYPAHIWIDAVLVEQGEILQPYFDGSTGINYTWDTVQDSAGLSRSYYYKQMSVRQQAVNNVLQRHTPLGISYTPPMYSVPPIE